MFSRGCLFLLIVILEGLFYGCSFTTPDSDRVAKVLKKMYPSVEVKWDETLSPKIDDWFNDLCSSTRFNGNVLVARHGKVIYQNSYGYANFQRKDTLTLEHQFQTGSVSKPFTALAIMILKERGLLSYDDTVSTHLDNFPYKDISIRQLLSHRSGLPNYNYFCDQYTDTEDVIYNKDVLRLMHDSVPAPYYPPDQRFDYCNTNFVLLASLVEEVSGRTFPEFMHNEVFKKAGMKSTQFFINGKQNRIPKAATGYHYPWVVALPTYQDGVFGDKGIYTTIRDLWYWYLALENEKIVSRKTLEEAFQPASKEKKGNKNYGLGWRLTTHIDSSRQIFHGGWWRGFNTLFANDVKNDAVIIILGNVRTKAIHFKFQELLGVIDPVRWQKQMEADSLYLQMQQVDSVK